MLAAMYEEAERLAAAGYHVLMTGDYEIYIIRMPNTGTNNRPNGVPPRGDIHTFQVSPPQGPRQGRHPVAEEPNQDNQRVRTA